ncbi:MAG TPA: hypothetical protein VLJ61_17545 [Pyrinomonadaceae bacterium]|nr:hypothetical protein [Pyrinomonadaceae bacterium]
MPGNRVSAQLVEADSQTALAAVTCAGSVKQESRDGGENEADFFKKDGCRRRITPKARWNNPTDLTRG